MHRVRSTDAVAVAVHSLAGQHGQPTLLVSHATGFHGLCYTPLGRALAPKFHVVGFDHRGHGQTPPPSNWDVDWADFGEDTVAVAQAIAPNGGLIGFGHSMGGASLLMAAHRHRSLFARLVLFEPIATPDTAARPEPESLPIVRGARRRRRRFDSFDEAYENFATKPPMSLMTPDALRSYVEGGFRAVDDEGGRGVVLRCDPEIEAAIFVNSRHNGVWALLPGIETPTLVLGGVVEDDEPSAWCAEISQRLPHGEYRHLLDQTHFGPFSHPDAVAAIVAGWVADA